MLIKADARSLPLRDGCVQTVVTSPPYFGLRSYPDARQLGLEASPAEYVAVLVAVFREVWRVLKTDGTVWLNLGDSYAGGGAAGSAKAYDAKWKQSTSRGIHSLVGTSTVVPIGLKAKDLLMIPARVALALQVDGWYLRSDIIWHKPNPMPESVTDRPTKAHEYLFLLTKSERYFYDAAAIREPYALSTQKEFLAGYNGTATKDYAAVGVQNPSDVKARILRRNRKDDGTSKASHDQSDLIDGVSWCGLGGLSGANKRTVWTIPTMPYTGAHFATMPEALVEPCILAGSKPGDLILDPFLGSGTVGAVADRLMRRWVGTDLSYHELAKQRTAQPGLRLVNE